MRYFLLRYGICILKDGDEEIPISERHRDCVSTDHSTEKMNPKERRDIQETRENQHVEMDSMQHEHCMEAAQTRHEEQVHLKSERAHQSLHQYTDLVHEHQRALKVENEEHVHQDELKHQRRAEAAEQCHREQLQQMVERVKRLDHSDRQ